jgi:hypothetical protein
VEEEDSEGVVWEAEGEVEDFQEEGARDRAGWAGAGTEGEGGARHTRKCRPQMLIRTMPPALQEVHNNIC